MKFPYCTWVLQNLVQKTLIILAKAVDRQSNRLHPEEANSELDDLVKELLDK